MMYAYMVGNVHFICLIQIQNTEIYTAFFGLISQKILIYEFLLISPSPSTARQKSS